MLSDDDSVYFSIDLEIFFRAHPRDLGYRSGINPFGYQPFRLSTCETARVLGSGFRV